ncbi:hypothetical protein M0812_01711 [Anaeramoeba flamelloides]|uniref:TCTP domain-containing protein n=1 Tax=Anaeramoeba flamelloides TaxID=1746091 RepID=A0AAV7YXV2_9EUKA|nr:hypothetical protein M0812_01711 [Anaeramoeba flamelloides]
MKILSDAYYIEEEGEIFFKAKGNIITIGNEEEEKEDTVKKSIDIVYSFELKKLSLTRTKFHEWAIWFQEHAHKYLQENNKERVAIFLTNFQLTLKKIESRFEDYTFYVGSNGNMESSLILMSYDTDLITPYFHYFKDFLYHELF